MTDLLEKCIVCRALIDEEDLFCANCGTEAPHESTRTNATQAGQASNTHNFECAGCGASMSFDAKAGTLRCPFCGAERLEEKPDTKSLAANRIVPFESDREQAVAIMRKWLGNGFWRPGNLAQQAVVADMTAVYVPYWVFQASTHTYWTADSSKTPFGARGDWYPMSGEHIGQYAGLLVGASGALTPSETMAICPFDLEQAVAPSEVDRSDAVSEQFRVQRKYARPLARQGLETLEARACQSDYVPGRCRNMKVNVRIENLSSEPVLLPVWIMAYRYKDELYRFLINGQTGKSTGEAPVSWLKMIVAIVILIMVVLALLAVVGIASS